MESEYWEHVKRFPHANDWIEAGVVNELKCLLLHAALDTSIGIASTMPFGQEKAHQYLATIDALYGLLFD